ALADLMSAKADGPQPACAGEVTRTRRTRRGQPGRACCRARGSARSFWPRPSRRANPPCSRRSAFVMHGRRPSISLQRVHAFLPTRLVVCGRVESPRLNQQRAFPVTSTFIVLQQKPAGGFGEE